MFKRLVLLTALASAVSCVYAQTIEQVGQKQGGSLPTAKKSITIDTTISVAAKTIFPTGWQGFSQKEVDINQPSKLQIQAGESLMITLQRWLTQENLTAQIDWDNRKFYLRNSSSMVQQTMAAAVRQSSHRIQTQQSQPQHYQKTYTAQQQEPVRNWTVMSTDIRLENTLERWTKESGYKLIWDADRHILISANDQFSGTLPEAINRLLSSPAIRDSDYPLEAVFYTNNPPVIRITRLGDQPLKNKE